MVSPILLTLLASGVAALPDHERSSKPHGKSSKCRMPKHRPVSLSDGLEDHSSSHGSASDQRPGHNRFGFVGEQTATYAQDGPIATLSPNVHWSYDTKPASNIIPIPAKDDSQMYYGVGDPTKAGPFAFLTYRFSSPSINLDHCDHVTSTEYESEVLTVKFSSEEAYEIATNTWKTEEGLILLCYTPGCGDHHKGERCYFKVSDLEFDSYSRIVRAAGKPRHPDEIITEGETEWGYWTPNKSRKKSGIRKPKPGKEAASGSSFSWSPSATAPPEKQPSSIPVQSTLSVSWSRISQAPAGFNATATQSSASPSGTLFIANIGTMDEPCFAPDDLRYGLPTVCLGVSFDEDLDDVLGYAPLSATNRQFALDLSSDYFDEGVPEDFDLDLDPNDPFFKVRRRQHQKRFIDDLVSGFVSAVETVVQPFVEVYEAAKDATSIPLSLTKDLTWNIPNPNSSNAEDKTLRDPEAKQQMSPWGDSILLKSFKSEGPNTNGFLNVYCVNCGVSGNAQITGRAAWSPIGGITQGEIEVETNIFFVLKIGVDAEITYTRDFKADLFNVGLPGLSFGVVTIGPRISIGTRANFQASAKGRLLAGAEMKLIGAKILVDLVNPSRSTHSGWDPSFQPILTAEGELMISASLGLPIGIRCGVQISTFDKSVGIIDEPSIKGVAQVAASIGTSSAEGFQAGFKEVNGCTGISTQITWRNRLYYDLLGSETNLLDSLDQPIASTCVPLPAATTSTTSTSDNTEATESADTNSDDPEAAQTTEAGSEDTDPTQTPEPDSDDVNPESETESSTESPPEARRVLHRQFDNSTDGITTTLSDDDSIDGEYSFDPIDNNAYFDADGREFALLTTPSGNTIVVSCSDGNLYPVSASGTDNKACSELWASDEDIVIYDGSSKLMHYYSNTMNALGVSRLRVDSDEEVPMGSVVVAWVPRYDSPDSDNYLYLAVDPEYNAFWPIVCDYADGRASKIFLARNPSDGIALLMSEELIYSVTGGRVSKCQVISLNQGVRNASRR